MQQMETEDLAIILAGMTSAKQLHGFQATPSRSEGKPD